MFLKDDKDRRVWIVIHTTIIEVLVVLQGRPNIRRTTKSELPHQHPCQKHCLGVWVFVAVVVRIRRIPCKIASCKRKTKTELIRHQNCREGSDTVWKWIHKKKPWNSSWMAFPKPSLMSWMAFLVKLTTVLYLHFYFSQHTYWKATQVMFITLSCFSKRFPPSPRHLPPSPVSLNFLS